MVVKEYWILKHSGFSSFKDQIQPFTRASVAEQAAERTSTCRSSSAVEDCRGPLISHPPSRPPLWTKQRPKYATTMVHRCYQHWEPQVDVGVSTLILLEASAFEFALLNHLEKLRPLQDVLGHAAPLYLLPQEATAPFRQWDETELAPCIWFPASSSASKVRAWQKEGEGQSERVVSVISIKMKIWMKNAASCENSGSHQIHLSLPERCRNTLPFVFRIRTHSTSIN